MITAKILGEKYIIDGKAADTPGFTPDMSAEIFYEVVRLINGKFLFLEDHLDRLSHSLSGSGISSPGNDVIRENLRLLQISNQFKEGNIRVCLQRKGNGENHLICYFIPYFYPETCMYKSGVQIMTFPHIRPNPGIKKWDDQFRVSVNQFIRNQGIYEAILLNDLKQVTEGSRSNIFFIDHENRLVSAPEEEILPGITRKYLLGICKKANITIIHRSIYLKELQYFKSCFISGTSPKVLPVWQLDGVAFEVTHPVLQFLMEQFDRVILDHLEDLLH